MTNPLAWKASTQIGLFTFYKSQCSQESSQAVLQEAQNQMNLVNKVEKKLEPNFFTNQSSNGFERQRKMFSDYVLCQNFLRNTRLKTEKRPSKLWPTHQRSLNKSDRMSKKFQNSIEQLSTDKVESQSKTINSEKNQINITFQKLNELRVKMTKKMDLDASIEAIKRKYFRSQSMNKLEPQCKLIQRNKIAADSSPSCTAKHIQTLRSPIEKYKNQPSPSRLQGHKQQRQSPNKKVSIGQKIYSLSNKNKFYLQKMVENLESDPSVHSRLFRQGHKGYKTKYIYQRLKTEGDFSQLNKPSENILDAFYNCSKIALKQRTQRTQQKKYPKMLVGNKCD